MPYLKIQTNVGVPEAERETMLLELSGTVAEALGKSERYVMVALESGIPMTFAGQGTPCAYLELKSIGLPADQTPRLAGTLCAAVGEALKVPPDRIYIEFSDAPRHMWGWNGDTF